MSKLRYYCIICMFTTEIITVHKPVASFINLIILCYHAIKHVLLSFSCLLHDYVRFIFLINCMRIATIHH